MTNVSGSSLAQQFQQAFGRAPVVVARAPGRVEFIGNHTDYNGGAVLGAAINRSVTVAAGPNADGRFRLRSTSGTPSLDLAAVPAGRLTGAEAWANYPLGVWRSLGDFNLPQPAGFDLLVDSDLPPGAGLSSSAALELATALALLQLAGSGPITPDRLATLGRHAENKYVGVPCGILDQGTSAFGAAGQLVHIDCRGPVFSRVPLPGAVHLWIFNTKEKHALVDGLYATRHRECMEAAKTLGVALLADLTPARLLPLLPKLTAEQAKRAQHIVAEHARVHATGEALAAGDLVAAGRLLTASHRSSQHLFENSTPALDRLVDLLEKHPAVLGARLTGGGFGGAVMALTRDSFTPADAEVIAAQSGSHPEVIHLLTADGARVVG
ncbi:Galactokinase [Lacunisphaera limnophila]|uniref:Galactokinase n=1 Tax=Lacunisphaera limnophila TaxID=1838286 RepID=A0A1D8AU18_9BACT|nr:galactokinase [Lacunisphaera limnophila]AOS44381.1 Galactokinase [Lacunisphaera limnophila]